MPTIADEIKDASTHLRKLLRRLKDEGHGDERKLVLANTKLDESVLWAVDSLSTQG